MVEMSSYRIEPAASEWKQNSVSRCDILTPKKWTVLDALSNVCFFAVRVTLKGYSSPAEKVINKNHSFNCIKHLQISAHKSLFHESKSQDVIFPQKSRFTRLKKLVFVPRSILSKLLFIYKLFIIGWLNKASSICSMSSHFSCFARSHIVRKFSFCAKQFLNQMVNKV